MPNKEPCQNSSCGMWRVATKTGCALPGSNETCRKFTITKPHTAKEYDTVAHNIQWLNEEYKKLEAKVKGYKEGTHALVSISEQNKRIEQWERAVELINKYLDNDGSRGAFDVMELASARKELNLFLSEPEK